MHDKNHNIDDRLSKLVKFAEAFRPYHKQISRCGEANRITEYSDIWNLYKNEILPIIEGGE